MLYIVKIKILTKTPKIKKKTKIVYKILFLEDFVKFLHTDSYK